MPNNFVFYLADYPVSDNTDTLKVVYIEYADFWEQYGYLSDREIIIPLNIQYHLHIRGEIANHIFEITNTNITEKDFVNAGFIQDPSFADFIKHHEKVR